MTAVIFKREHKDGLEFSAVYVSGVLLQFHGNVAERELPAGSEHDIYWRIIGPNGSSLTVTETTLQTPEKTIVGSSIGPEDNGRVSDFTLFTV